MARSGRRTEPLETHTGVLTTYAEIEPVLLDGEFRGRAWIHRRARASPLATPTDADILELHREMYAPHLTWAGITRKDARGPGGEEFVPSSQIRMELYKLAGDVAVRVAAAGSDPDIGQVAEIVADFHHRFQWIHPFQDTNGRTGRVLDLFLLWVTFGLAGPDVASSLAPEPFPSPDHQEAYYEGLGAADNGRPERLRAYYTERFVSTFQPATANP